MRAARSLGRAIFRVRFGFDTKECKRAKLPEGAVITGLVYNCASDERFIKSQNLRRAIAIPVSPWMVYNKKTWFPSANANGSRKACAVRLPPYLEGETGKCAPSHSSSGRKTSMGSVSIQAVQSGRRSTTLMKIRSGASPARV